MNHEDVCQLKIINKDKVERVKKQMIDDNKFQSLSDTFKTISDKTRLEILYALSKQELCVCDLSAVVNMSISLVSHQLRLLRDKKLVKFRKEGKSVYYSLDDEHVVQLIKMAYDHLIE
ncbi:MAG: winged helix-turn-helix transcriptional regulator [Thermoplasmatales archaeon]|nr:MAG: winged helix-turn-helix transcriptional regulator [Thermoplasmatales archaeon]